jgi:hypothetical protein
VRSSRSRGRFPIAKSTALQFLCQSDGDSVSTRGSHDLTTAQHMGGRRVGGEMSEEKPRSRETEERGRETGTWKPSGMGVWPLWRERPRGTAVAGSSMTLKKEVLAVSKMRRRDSLWKGAGVGREGRRITPSLSSRLSPWLSSEDGFRIFCRVCFNLSPISRMARFSLSMKLKSLADSSTANATAGKVFLERSHTLKAISSGQKRTAERPVRMVLEKGSCLL